MSKNMVTLEYLLSEPQFQMFSLERKENGNYAHSIRELQKFCGGADIASYYTVYNASKQLREAKGWESSFNEKEGLIPDVLEPAEKPAPKKPRAEFKQKLLQAQLTPPIEKTPDTGPGDPDYVQLKRRIALLEEQLSWAQKADSSSRTGGKLHLLISDIHLCGRDHMLACYQEMCEKSLTLIQQYQPDEIVVVLNGDAVAGTGIYRNQHVDTIVQSTTDQVKMAAYKIYEFNEMLKKVATGTVSWKIICGNHDRAMGENIAPYFVLTARELGVDATYCGDFKVFNLASNGYYHLYAEHGYGYSKLSPSGAGWWSDMQGKLWSMSRKYFGEKRIRRISHGHTHWLQTNMERMTDLYVDTTGGCQRNERAVLGKSPRPMGFIAYVSPRNFEGILDPITIRPELETFYQEWEDAELWAKNMDDCTQTLLAYEKKAQDSGLLAFDGWEGR